MYIYNFICTFDIFRLEPPKEHVIINPQCPSHRSSGAPQIRQLGFHLALRFGVAAHSEEDDGEALALETFHLAMGPFFGAKKGRSRTKKSWNVKKS